MSSAVTTVAPRLAALQEATQAFEELCEEERRMLALSSVLSIPIQRVYQAANSINASVLFQYDAACSCAAAVEGATKEIWASAVEHRRARCDPDTSVSGYFASAMAERVVYLEDIAAALRLSGVAPLVKHVKPLDSLAALASLHSADEQAEAERCDDFMPTPSQVFADEIAALSSTAGRCKTAVTSLDVVMVLRTVHPTYEASDSAILIARAFARLVLVKLFGRLIGHKALTNSMQGGRKAVSHARDGAASRSSDTTGALSPATTTNLNHVAIDDEGGLNSFAAAEGAPPAPAVTRSSSVMATASVGSNLDRTNHFCDAPPVSEELMASTRSFSMGDTFGDLSGMLMQPLPSSSGGSCRPGSNLSNTPAGALTEGTVSATGGASPPTIPSLVTTAMTAATTGGVTLTMDAGTGSDSSPTNTAQLEADAHAQAPGHHHHHHHHVQNRSHRHSHSHSNSNSHSYIHRAKQDESRAASHAEPSVSVAILPPASYSCTVSAAALASSAVAFTSVSPPASAAPAPSNPPTHLRLPNEHRARAGDAFHTNGFSRPPGASPDLIPPTLPVQAGVPSTGVEFAALTTSSATVSSSTATSAAPGQGAPSPAADGSSDDYSDDDFEAEGTGEETASRRSSLDSGSRTPEASPLAIGFAAHDVTVTVLPDVTPVAGEPSLRDGDGEIDDADELTCSSHHVPGTLVSITRDVVDRELESFLPDQLAKDCLDLVAGVQGSADFNSPPAPVVTVAFNLLNGTSSKMRTSHVLMPNDILSVTLDQVRSYFGVRAEDSVALYRGRPLLDDQTVSGAGMAISDAAQVFVVPKWWWLGHRPAPAGPSAKYSTDQFVADPRITEAFDLYGLQCRLHPEVDDSPDHVLGLIKEARASNRRQQDTGAEVSIAGPGGSREADERVPSRVPPMARYQIDEQLQLRLALRGEARRRALAVAAHLDRIDGIPDQDSLALTLGPVARQVARKGVTDGLNQSQTVFPDSSDPSHSHHAFAIGQARLTFAQQRAQVLEAAKRRRAKKARRNLKTRRRRGRATLGPSSALSHSPGFHSLVGNDQVDVADESNPVSREDALEMLAASLSDPRLDDTDAFPSLADNDDPHPIEPYPFAQPTAPAALLRAMAASTTQPDAVSRSGTDDDGHGSGGYRADTDSDVQPHAQARLAQDPLSVVHRGSRRPARRHHVPGGLTSTGKPHPFRRLRPAGQRAVMTAHGAPTVPPALPVPPSRLKESSRGSRPARPEYSSRNRPVPSTSSSNGIRAIRPPRSAEVAHTDGVPVPPRGFMSYRSEIPSRSGFGSPALVLPSVEGHANLKTQHPVSGLAAPFPVRPSSELQVAASASATSGSRNTPFTPSALLETPATCTPVSADRSATDLPHGLVLTDAEARVVTHDDLLGFSMAAAESGDAAGPLERVSGFQDIRTPAPASHVVSLAVGAASSPSSVSNAVNVDHRAPAGRHSLSTRGFTFSRHQYRSAAAAPSRPQQAYAPGTSLNIVSYSTGGGLGSASGGWPTPVRRDRSSATVPETSGSLSGSLVTRPADNTELQGGTPSPVPVDGALSVSGEGFAESFHGMVPRPPSLTAVPPAARGGSFTRRRRFVKKGSSGLMSSLFGPVMAPTSDVSQSLEGVQVVGVSPRSHRDTSPTGTSTDGGGLSPPSIVVSPFPQA